MNSIIGGLEFRGVGWHWTGSEGWWGSSLKLLRLYIPNYTMRKPTLQLAGLAVLLTVPQAFGFSLNTGEITTTVGGVNFDNKYTVYADLDPNNGVFGPNDTLYGNPAGLARIGQVTPQWVNPGSTPPPNGGKWISPGANAVTTGSGGTDPNPEYFHFVLNFTVYSAQTIPVNIAADNQVKAYLNGSLVSTYTGFGGVGGFNRVLAPGSHQVVFSVLNFAQASGNPAGLLVSSGAINVPDGGSTLAMTGGALLALAGVRRRMGC